MKHIISYEDVKKGVVSSEIASSTGNGSHKALQVTVNLSTSEVSYQVKERNEVVLSTDVLEEAVDFYNNLP